MDLCLRFPEAPWPPPPRFKFELFRAIEQAGGEGLVNMRVRLREGSVIAVLRGPDEIVEQLRLHLALEELQVLGYQLGPMWNSRQAMPQLSKPSPQASPSRQSVAGLRGSVSASSLSVTPAPADRPSQSRLNRRSSLSSNVSSAQDEEPVEISLDELFKQAVEEALGPDVEVKLVGKQKYSVEGKEMAVIVKNGQATVKHGASWVPAVTVLAQIIGKTPHSSQPGTPRGTPRGSFRESPTTPTRDESPHFGRRGTAPPVTQGATPSPQRSGLPRPGGTRSSSSGHPGPSMTRSSSSGASVQARGSVAQAGSRLSVPGPRGSVSQAKASPFGAAKARQRNSTPHPML